MSKNYNINLNPKVPSDEQIAKYKNFDALLEQFEATKASQKSKRPKIMALSLEPRIRRLVYYSGAAAAALIGLVLYFSFWGSATSPIDEATYFASQPYLNPPLDVPKAQLASFKVNVNQGGVYEYESGSRLVVPVAAFMDDRGNLVEGEVNIYYREYHDYIDFFLFGTPMTYDSTGIRYNLLSAGMMEIFAEQNGVRVHMAPNKEISVELVSEINVSDINAIPYYSIYQLDTINRNWVYQDIDNMQIIEGDVLDDNDPLYPVKKELLDNIEAIDKESEKALAAIENSIPKPQEPLKPQSKYDNTPTFELDFLKDLAPSESSLKLLEELEKQYKGIIWQVSPNVPSAEAIEELSTISSTIWASGTFDKVNDRDYILTLSKPGLEKKLQVTPVLTGSNLNAALAKYEEEKTAYQTKLKAWEDQLKDQKLALRQKTKEQKIAAQNAFEERLASLHQQGLEPSSAQGVIKRKVVNRFLVSAFGVWHCAKPVTPFATQLNARFVDQRGRSFTQNKAYIVDRSTNTVHRFLAQKGVPMRFNANSENLLWLITDDNKLAVFRPENFKGVDQKKGSYTFVMTVIDQEIKQEKDVRKILQF